MIKIKLLVVFLISLLMGCTSDSQKNDAIYRLLPTPNTISIEGQSSLAPGEINTLLLKEDVKLPLKSIFGENFKVQSSGTSQLSGSIDEKLNDNPEYYELIISSGQISITGASESGLMYGLVSLKQILDDAKSQNAYLPVVTIKDVPKLSWRAIHLDVKHHLEKPEYYYDLIDELLMMKVNAIIIEIEDKLQYEKQAKVGAPGAVSIEDWKKLSDYALNRNIRISPLVQGLGHASFILKHPEYTSLRDNPESDWAFNPLDSQTYKVQFDLYDDALKAFPHGKYLHVGGDEVHTTGRESGKSPLELQMHWLTKVANYSERKDRIPIFWDDMPLKNAGVYWSIYNRNISDTKVDSLWNANSEKLESALDLFPKNVIYMRWNYSNPESYGNTRAMEWFNSHGLKVMGATAGQTRWVLMPQNESNISAIRSFAKHSINTGIEGLLLTLWDDDSPHFELYKRGISAFAQYSWSGVEMEKDSFKILYRHRAFGHKGASDEFAFIDDLEKPVSFWKNSLLKKGDRNRLRKMDNPFDALIDLPKSDSAGTWTQKYEDKIQKAREMMKINDSVSKRINELKNVSEKNQYRLEVYEVVNDITRFNNKVLITLAELDNSEGSTREKIMEEVKSFEEMFISLRNNSEEVFGKTRILNKSEEYILDQDHHVHLANQSKNMDWLFIEENIFLERLGEVYNEK